jgi:hypothetical protein
MRRHARHARHARSSDTRDTRAQLMRSCAHALMYLLSDPRRLGARWGGAAAARLYERMSA